jgi:hypothetical protein
VAQSRDRCPIPCGARGGGLPRETEETRALSVAETSGHFARAADPKGLCLLDVSTLKSWPTSDLTQLARSHCLTIPDCLFAEVLTKEDPEEHAKLLLKLRGVPCVLAASLGEHFKWEVKHKQAAGLLLRDDYSPGDPRQTAATLVSDTVADLQAGQTGSDLLGDFKERVDRPAELHWESFHKPAMEAIKNHPVIRQARGEGTKELLDVWRQVHVHSEMIMDRHFLDFVRSQQAKNEKPYDMSDVRDMDHRWCLFRYFVALMIYTQINAVANPPHFKHERLNQRTDIHYISLLSPGMTLITMDTEMSEVAEVASPDSRRVRAYPKTSS